jgi:hypothetical protein
MGGSLQNREKITRIPAMKFRPDCDRGFYGLLLAGLCLLLVSGCSTAGNLKTEQKQKMKSENIAVEWGIQKEMIALTAAGHMVDFRYRVLDAEKAKPLFDRSAKAYLVHQATNQTLVVPTTAKVGPLRNTGTPEEGKVYWMFFGNPGVVKPGDKVNVVIGNVEINDLVVQ